jgi:hypothetical protein
MLVRPSGASGGAGMVQTARRRHVAYEAEVIAEEGSSRRLGPHRQAYGRSPMHYAPVVRVAMSERQIQADVDVLRPTRSGPSVEL